MNWRTTAWLAGTAVVLALFILAVERPARLRQARATAAARLLPAFTPDAVRSIEIRTTNAAVTLAKTNGIWEIVTPERHPAHGPVIAELLERVAGLAGHSILSTAELRSRPGAPADFGLNPPTAVLRFDAPAGRVELLLGVHSLNGAQVYFQIPGIPGIFATDSALLDHLPRQPDDWRETILLPLDRLAFDRIRVSSAGAAFALSRAASNGVWEMTEPRPARADSTRVGMLLRQFSLLQISRFLAPTSAPAAEVAGLRPPRVALGLARGSNEIYQLTLGAAFTNGRSSFAYAQRAGEPDLLAVPGEALELLRVSYKDLLDRRLVRFERNQVREISFAGPESFRLVRADDHWQLLPADVRADSQLVERLFRQLATLEMLDLAKEVVTDLDLATYGLAPPTSGLSLLAAPGDTNSVLTQLHTGTLRDNQVFARVPGDPAVYVVNPADLDDIPRLSWQLRDREIWHFDSPQVAAITARQPGFEWTVRHPATNDWTVAPGIRNELNPFALEEAVHRFGETRALAWRGIGDARAAALGIGQVGELIFEFRSSPARDPLRLRLGKSTPAGHRYAAVATTNGTPAAIFELHGPVFDTLWRELGIPTSGAPTDLPTSPASPPSPP